MINKINLHLLDRFGTSDELAFIRPIGSNLYRVCSIPEKYQSSDKYVEIRQVLNTLCLRHHKGIYYFRFEDDEALIDVIETLAHMDVFACLITETRFGRTKYGFPIAEILN